MKTENLFSLICFLVLMQNDEGLKGKAPIYIKEKFGIVGIDGDLAFDCLDISLQRKVIDYCNFWNVAIPERIKKGETR